ncbi:HK97-gp10 family putative phage morphogenesis protein [Antarcticirhabdus aurantiaca]|uniref:HK97 gp10 family phage protein n=1 Tax=Antarcticirhabdus aurantiaca TaxID=2606717 RepID=A0ACD4NHF7_9HYPH|nr:HK97 gp10 family phage protein [Jeongeuplla avenae]
MSAQLERLRRRLAAVPASVKKAVEPALVKSGEEIAGRMKALAPEDTGDLKASIRVTPPGRSTPPYSQPGGATVAGENQVLITAGGDDVRYPHLQEYGTTTAPAQPFFWPAYRLTKKRAANRIKRAISKAVRDGWGT